MEIGTELSSPSQLTSALPGKVVLPEDVRFDEARRAWNLAIDQRPAAVAFPESPQDVSAAVLFAREVGLRVAAQGTGHGAGTLGSLEDTILVKTERMGGVSVDPVRRTVRVEAGVVWLEVLEAAAGNGLAALAGSSPDVGVVGYTLGGGISFLCRKHGLAANHVSAIELVTADGRLVRADSENEPDLFWALRGGGGSFGVVTAIEFKLFPIAQAYAGILWYPIDRGAEVLHAWRQLTQSELPDELTTVGRFLNLPSLPEIPEPLRGKSFAIVEAYHLGDPAQADDLLAPLRALRPVNDTIATVPMPALTHLHMDPEQPVPAAGDGLMIDHLTVDALDAFVEVAGAHAQFPLVSIELRHLGGELRRERPEHGALASIDADYAMGAVGLIPAPELEAPVLAQVQAVKATLAPWAARHMTLNFAETQQETATFWTEQAYDRLRRIKTAVDPDDLIQANHPIPPASPPPGNDAGARAARDRRIPAHSPSPKPETATVQVDR
jgi:FAD/FMN-containing dehydrogenase